MPTQYKVRAGETIGDVVMNSCGALTADNWSAILDANGFDEWVPALIVGSYLTIPDGLTVDLNTLRQLAVYPANNNANDDTYTKISAVWGLMNPNDWILAGGVWNDAGYWRDLAIWKDN